MVALRLAKAGYGGGDPERILCMRADRVLELLEYESYHADYERAWLDLNREKK